jgi:hypothetical protein
LNVGARLKVWVGGVGEMTYHISARFAVMCYSHPHSAGCEKLAQAQGEFGVELLRQSPSEVY